MSGTWVLVGVGSAALGFALLVGGSAERIYATARAAATVGDLLIRANSSTETVGLAVLIDLALLAIILPMALKLPKVWPLAAASICVATMMTDAAQLLVHASPQAYGIARGGWELLANGVVAVGAWRARRTLELK